MGQIIIEKKLSELGIPFKYLGNGEIDFLENVSDINLAKISATLSTYGIDIIENQKSIFVQKIKDAIKDMISQEEPLLVKSSIYLSEKLNYSYGYIANLFSDITYTSVENYIIMQKIELAKQLMLTSKLSLTEIAYRLNYSSVAHLSTQFKNTTGITPSAFTRIINKRRALQFNNE